MDNYEYVVATKSSALDAAATIAIDKVISSCLYD